MSTVILNFPIAHISGKLSRSSRTIYHYRRQPNADGVQTNYTSVRRHSRSTEPTEAELQRRATFAAISARVRARRSDPVQFATDQYAFRHQRHFRTFHSYLWHLCSQA